MSEKYLTELHKEHVAWSKNLGFYRDEIETFKHRLEEIIVRNTKTEVTAQVEHFQNQFIRQNEVIDELLHDINAEESLIVKNAMANNVATDRRKAPENEELVDRMKVF
ncbi:MAG: hypothetical protein JJ975_16960, partial [Bacteroidia bacterium]|nr:hypothetical protein [Bacteroidia bacterium]